MTILVGASLVVVGVIHLLPLVGVAGADRLSALYGVPITGPDLAVLMRHRAVLFGLLGAFLVYAAFVPDVRTLAFVAGFVSVVSFLVLARSEGATTAEVGRVVAADWAALACLVVGAAAHAYSLLRGPAG